MKRTFPITNERLAYSPAQSSPPQRSPAQSRRITALRPSVGAIDPLLRRHSYSSSPVKMIPQSQNSSLQWLQHIEKVPSRPAPPISVVVGLVPDAGWVFVVRVQRIVRVLELAGAVMEELGNSQGPRTDAVGAHCREFMIAMKVASPLLSALRQIVKLFARTFLPLPLMRLNSR